MQNGLFRVSHYVLAGNMGKVAEGAKWMLEHGCTCETIKAGALSHNNIVR